MSSYKKRYSLLHEMTLFIGVVMLVIAGYFLCRIESIQSEATVKKLSSQAEQVEKYFTERVLYTGSILGYMGRQIQQYDVSSPKDQLAYIDNLFQSFSVDPNIRNILSSTLIGWVNSDFQAVVDGVYRVMEKPIDLSSRDYTHATVKKPWVVKLGQPIVGSTSGKWIIPAGVGITDRNGKWLGTLIIGFQQSFLQDNFSRILEEPDASVALMDMAGQVLAEAPHHFISNTIPIKDKIATIPLPSVSNVPMKNTARFSHTGYFGWGISYYYYKIPGYDYIILVSMNNPVTVKALGRMVLHYLPELVAVIGFLALGVWFLKWRIVNPIIQLSNTAQAISEGNINAPMPMIHSQEGYNLAQALERVKTLFANEQRFKEELTLAHAEVQQANDSLERKVIERTQALEKALRVKSEFIDNISHEIRSPVQGVTVISGGLVDSWEHIAEERRFTYVQEVHKSGERLLSLVNNLLDFSKMNAGKMEFAMMPGSDIVEVVRAILEEVKPLAEARNLTLGLEVPSDEVLAEFDRLRIGQVVRNLLSNAIKFTDQGSSVTVIIAARLFDGNESVSVTVSDEGPGVPEDEREQVFDPFVQSSRTKTRAGGTGLGLTLCAEIIMAHHGLIYVENTEAKGAAFTFVIPVHHRVVLPVKRRSAMQEKNHPINVLAVDDEIHCLMSMRIMLEGSGYKVIEAQGGTKALDYLNRAEERVDIILLDMMMPDMYGTDVLMAVKQNERFRHIPIIIQSGVANDMEISKAMQCGAHGHIRKPYNRAVLLEAIGKAIQTV